MVELIAPTLYREARPAPLRLRATVKLALAVGSSVLLAIAAFRRARRRVEPGPRAAPVARPAEGNPPGQATTRRASLRPRSAARGVAALVGIVWVGLELLT